MRIFPRLQRHIDAALAEPKKVELHVVRTDDEKLAAAHNADADAAAERARTGDTGNVL